jgi:hemolysin activation/secretion protein
MNKKTSRYRYGFSPGGRHLYALFFGFLIAFLSSPAFAQRIGQELPTPASDSSKEVMQLPLERLFVRKIRVTGSTVFSTEELAQVTSPYVNRELTSQDLEELRRALTAYYVERGHVNSGAVIPDQTVVDGEIRFHIIEGELSKIEVEGNRWFRSSYIQNRLALGSQPPLDINALQRRLILLQQDDRIQLLNGELRPGVKPGDSVLKVRVEEKVPLKVSATFDNYQAPSVGAERFLLNIAPQNLTGNGDILSLTFGGSEGLKPLIEARYSIPITVYDTILSLRYEKNDYTIVERPFDDLDVESDTDYYTVTLSHPFYRSLNHEFALGVTGEHIRNETTLLGEPFSFSAGAEDGESIVTALRFFQEYFYRTQRQALAVRSRFSLGIDALDATTSGTSSVPDSEFFAWLGQFQWAAVWGDIGIQTILRTDVQLAADSLLSVELISVGGRYSVRGYRENTLVRDNAVITSLECRLPVFRDRWWADYVQLAPFFDFGHGWNKDVATPSPETIYSIGLGFRWGATLKKSNQGNLRAQLELYWGHDLKDVDKLADEDDLQDDGIHLQFIVSGF